MVVIAITVTVMGALVELFGTVSNRVKKITAQRNKITRKLQAIY